jgi:ribosomal protein S18 acetylase RimI-like enzyme
MIYRKVDFPEKEKLKQLSVLSYGIYKDMLSEEGWDAMNCNLDDDIMWEKLINDSSVFICENEGNIIGSAYFIPQGHPTSIYPTDWSYIRMISVHPDNQKKGIGTRLLAHCIDYAKQEGEKIVGLHTAEKMIAARRIYERFGFNKVRQLDSFFGWEYWLYRLDLKI